MREGKRIGILTSGGDCPGLNAVIYAVTKAAAHKGWKVYGIPNGTDGLLELGDLRLNTMPIIWLLLREINSLAGILFLRKSLANGTCGTESLEIDEHTFDIPGQKGMNVLLFLGGSVLGCRGQKNYPSDEEEKKKILADEKKKILAGYKELALDALIAVGGDGSLEIIDDLACEGGWNLIAIPKTIDNDVPSTEQVVGFNTAVEVVAAHLRDLINTAAAHDRVMIVQVMGRDAGHLALQAGIAGGADAILIPELTPILKQRVIGRLCQKLAQIHRDRRKFALIVVAEGVKKTPAGGEGNNIGDYLKRQLEKYRRTHCDSSKPGFCGLKEEVEIRVTVPGHLQRCSPPSAFDRRLAVEFGVEAVDLIDELDNGSKPYQQLLVWQNGGVQQQPLEKAIALIRQEKAGRMAQGQSPCASPVLPDGALVHVARRLGICLGDGSEECGF